jgi:hypothetical protein
LLKHQQLDIQGERHSAHAAKAEAGLVPLPSQMTAAENNSHKRHLVRHYQYDSLDRLSKIDESCYDPLI